MRFKKSFQLALNILIHSKLRSWLTIIGIIIGIGAVVSIVSISQGAQQQLESQLGSLGADILTVTPGMSRAKNFGGGFAGGGRPEDLQGTTSSSTEKNLTQKDILTIRTVENVNVVMGTISGRQDATYLSKTASVSIVGVDPLYWKEITTEELSSGRLLSSGDSTSIVIGENLATTTFEGIPLNSKLTIEGKSFTIIGILESGSTIYMPISIARTTLEDVGTDEFHSISIKIQDVEKSNETVNEITSKLLLSRGILDSKNQDFTISNPSAMQETMQETMSTMALFLGAIAAISLLVGGIGIANTMFTSVLEKTKEIGIMKSIGAKNKDILSIFLINSGLIGLVGGIGGIILGIIGSAYVGSFLSSEGGMMRGLSNTSITSSLLFGALFFSVAIGIIAGIIPAYRASRLNPVDALRYQ